jgi:AcrR family transcriptional regulator
MQKESPVKDKIIATAARLFYMQGYNLTGINQVISEAGIARASLYNHFPAKTDLLLAYLDDFQEKWFHNLDKFLKPCTDPKEKILNLFNYRAHSQTKKGYLGCPFIKINDEAGNTDERILKLTQQNKDRLKAYIHELVIISGHRQLLTDEELTHTIYLLMEGGITSAAIYKNIDELQVARQSVSKLL